MTNQEPGAISEAAAVAAGAVGQHHHELIVESMTEGVSLATEDGVIVYTNPAEDQMFGYARGELIGQHVSVQNAYSPGENEARVGEVIATLRSAGEWEGEWHNRRKDGTDFYTASRIKAVALGGRTHWLCVQRDITAVRQAEARLRESEERLRIAMEAGKLGSWWFDVPRGVGGCSHASAAMIGLGSGGREVGFEEWRSIIHPLDLPAVETAMAAVVAGDMPTYDVEYRVIHPNGEIRRIHAAAALQRDPAGKPAYFVGTFRDVTQTRAQAEAYRDSAGRLDLAVTAHGIGIFDWYVQTGKLVWTRQEEELFGLPEGSFGGDIAEWAQCVVPGDLEGMQADMATAMAERRAGMDFDFRIRRPDGETRWIEGAARFLYDEDGTPLRMVGTNVDVTERRQAENRQRLLVNELNHRVKNTLAIIQGIARQSFRGTDVPKEKREAFEGRLAALSAAHNLLTRESWEAASIAQVIADALAPHGTNRVRSDGPELRLPPKTAVSLALAMHELGTNAAKYGALSVPDGQVRVVWTADGDRLSLVWEEKGGPPVVPPASRGFGTRMIERALAAEFGGEARIEFEPEGVVCRLEARIPG